MTEKATASTGNGRKAIEKDLPIAESHVSTVSLVEARRTADLDGWLREMADSDDLIEKLKNGDFSVPMYVKQLDRATLEQAGIFSARNEPASLKRIHSELEYREWNFGFKGDDLEQTIASPAAASGGPFAEPAAASFANGCNAAATPADEQPMAGTVFVSATCLVAETPAEEEPMESVMEGYQSEIGSMFGSAETDLCDMWA